MHRPVSKYPVSIELLRSDGIADATGGGVEPLGVAQCPAPLRVQGAELGVKAQAVRMPL
jgi:hypothetical protein